MAADNKKETYSIPNHVVHFWLIIYALSVV